MLVSRLDYAKYPFLKAASQYVKALDLRLEELDSPEYVEVVKRAEQRIEETLVTGTVTWKGGQTGEAEIMSFPVAMAIVANIGDDFLRRRFSLAEAKRTYELLREEADAKVVEIAVTCMGWRAKVTPQRIGRPSGITLGFIDYLRNAVRFHDDKWKLVNRTLSGGEVILRKEELARLIAEEVRIRFEKTLERSPKAELPPLLAKRVERIKQLLAERKEKFKIQDMPREIVLPAFPPCVKKLNDSLLAGQHIPHIGRFTLTSFFLRIGMGVDELVRLYTSISDFNEGLTRYQVEHIAGRKGSGTQYAPPNCRTLQTHGFCTNPDDLCKTIRHPLTYYRRKVDIVRNRGNDPSG